MPQAGQSSVREQRVELHLPHAVVPQVDREQRALIASRWPLRILIASQASIDAITLTIGAEDAGRVAGGRGARRRRLGHQAAQAGGFAGQDRHRLPLGAEAAAVDPGDAELQRGVVEQKPRLEVVGAVEDARRRRRTAPAMLR